MAGTDSIDIGIIDGMGYELELEDVVEHDVRTPYGETSTPVRVGLLAGRRVATLMRRRGLDDPLQAHLVPYQANVWALASLGVSSLITTSPAGALRDSFAPGMFVVVDQLIDRTSGRPHTFYDEGVVVELAAAEPFDPTLSGLAAEALAGKHIRSRDFGTAVVINGPRFSTRAESRWYAASGGDIVLRTLLPETALAMELGMGVVNLAFITASDSGAATGPTEATSSLVRRRVAQGRPMLDRLLGDIVRTIPAGFRPNTDVPAEAIAGVLARAPR